MVGEFSSNIRQVAAEIKLLDKKTATAIRKAARVAVTKAGEGTLEAIKASASWSDGSTSNDEHPHTSIPAATTLKFVFGVSSNGVKIATNAKKAPHARPLEKGSQGSGGAYDRHPVFERDKAGRVAVQKYNATGFGKFRSAFGLGRKGPKVTWVNQPTRPFFYDTAKAREKLNEADLWAAVETAIRAAGWRG